MFSKTLFVWFIFLIVPTVGCFSQVRQITLDNREETKEENLSVWDFGDLEEGKHAKHSFLIENGSSLTMHIKDVTTSCGCTISEVKKTTLLKGESSSIDVTLDTKGYSGQIQQNIFVFTDAIDNPILKFVIKANVVRSKANH